MHAPFDGKVGWIVAWFCIVRQRTVGCLSLLHERLVNDSMSAQSVSNLAAFFNGYGGERVVVIRPSLVEALRGNAGAAILLSQFIYWTLRTPDPDGWFYNTQEELRQQTGMGKAGQQSARKVLRAAGLLEEERRGVPAKLYYRVDLAATRALLEPFASRLPDVDPDAVDQPDTSVRVLPSDLLAGNTRTLVRRHGSELVGRLSPPTRKEIKEKTIKALDLNGSDPYDSKKSSSSKLPETDDDDSITSEIRKAQTFLTNTYNLATAQQREAVITKHVTAHGAKKVLTTLRIVEERLLAGEHIKDPFRYYCAAVRNETRPTNPPANTYNRAGGAFPGGDRQNRDHPDWKPVRGQVVESRKSRDSHEGKAEEPDDTRTFRASESRANDRKNELAQQAGSILGIGGRELN